MDRNGTNMYLHDQAEFGHTRCISFIVLKIDWLMLLVETERQMKIVKLLPLYKSVSESEYIKVVYKFVAF